MQRRISNFCIYNFKVNITNIEDTLKAFDDFKN